MVRHNGHTTFAGVFSYIQETLRSDTSLKVRPREIDIANLPAVRSVLESYLNSDVSQDGLEKKLPRVLPRAIRKWSSNAVQELEQLAREQLCLPPLSKPSCLSWVIFLCKACSRNCRQRLMFDEALSHHHLYRATYREDKHTRKEIGEYDKFIMEYPTHPWNIQDLRVDVKVSRRVENLVRRMGQNPSRVTYDELCYSTVEVVCGLCNSQAATRMDFGVAVCRSVRVFLRY